MQDADLFLSLAEIAGVFVGFGALIAVRSGGASEAHEVTYIRSVVWTGLWVVIAALVPVVISRYDITGHGLWAACSLVGLVLFWVMWIVNRRTPEHREDMATYSRRTLMVFAFIILGILGLPLNIALSLVVLGVLPELEAALYLTAVMLSLFLGAFALMTLVLSQRRRESA